MAARMIHAAGLGLDAALGFPTVITEFCTPDLIKTYDASQTLPFLRQWPALPTQPVRTALWGLDC